MVDPATGEPAYDDTAALEEVPAGHFDQAGANDGVTVAVAAQDGLFRRILRVTQVSGTWASVPIPSTA